MKLSKLLLGITVISFTATLFIYPNLPDQIPIHWGIDGNIDRYGARYTALITGALPIFLYLLMLVVPKIDPRKDSYEKHMSAYQIIVIFIILFLAGIHWLVMGYSLGYKIDIILFIKAGIGLLFMVIGNYLPVIKHNYTLGIRVPWTLASEFVWEKTHKVGGYTFVITGIVWFVFSFVNKPWVFFLLMSILFANVIGVVAYSYLLYKKEEANKR